MIDVANPDFDVESLYMRFKEFLKDSNHQFNIHILTKWLYVNNYVTSEEYTSGSCEGGVVQLIYIWEKTGMIQSLLLSHCYQCDSTTNCHICHIPPLKGWYGM
jgi:hypothetical protein